MLIAMSGVRVRDDELRALGLTLPGFVERGEVIASLPSLSLLTLAAHSPEHWELEYREIDELGKLGTLAASVEAGQFDLIALLKSVYSSRDRAAFHLRDARVPRYDLLDVSRYNRLTIQTARGCPLDCTFCGASRTLSSYKNPTGPTVVFSRS